MSVNNPEGGYLRTWLDTVFELPWGKESKGNIDLARAKKILDKNHYGLEEVKDRILEYIAVLQLKQKEAKNSANLPTILCFVGAPGVGKTSIGKSIAESLGRKFVKISLGGVRDEAEIRGHRRTYVGAMPGKIIVGMKQAKSMNPVFMLDEIDKLGNDFRGDPSSALLEALDPEQNNGFEDHYLDMPFDLSDVIFITTANTLDTIPAALRDRLEIIRYSGYTEEEKFHIAKDHLLEKVRKGNGLKPVQLTLTDSEIKMIISRYTREAGVRSLERELNKVMRKSARQIAEKKLKKVSATPKVIRDFLGPEKFDPTLREKKDEVGLATGLAWTSVGGEVLFIEVALTPGKGVVKLTGKLGDVMKESAQAALTYMHANAKSLGIDPKRVDKTNVHIHVPEGAVPKDGPSAGITMCTAIVSAFTGRSIKREIAMTGEITLRGRVMRIGGLKEKSIAAHQAGCKIVIIPKENERDLVEVPESVKKDIKFIPVEHVEEVLKLALNK
jgi:ATP-dependent Lon protease